MGDYDGINSEPGSNTRLQKWVDPAMFTSEKLDAHAGPKVYLLSMSTDPLGSIAACAKMYVGEVVRDLAEVTDDERRHYLSEMQKTKLAMPLESVQFHFMIEGVTRGFTHQLVRQRTAAYAQESMRFAVVEDNFVDRVQMPPSLAGTQGGELKRVQEEWQQAWTDEDGRLQYDLHEEDPKVMDLRDRQGRLPENEKWRDYWDRALKAIEGEYKHLIDAGMPAEDARGLLPHNITTRVNYITNLRGLLDHAGNRLCTQAQFEWRAVFARIAEAIRSRGGWYYENVPFGPTGKPPLHEARSADWQHEAIAALLKPVCYQTGKCAFKAEFDRTCKIRDRVNANESINRPSSEWDKKYTHSTGRLFPGASDDPTTEWPWAERLTSGYPGRPIIPAIQPAEWLLDPGAAR